jgi:hypothetical protein
LLVIVLASGRAASCGALLSLSCVGAHRHHSGTPDALRNVLGVIVDSLQVLFHNVVLALVILATLENVTSLKVGHGGTAIATKVSLLLSLVLHLSGEGSSHVSMVLCLSLGSVKAVFAAERIKSFVQ